MSEKRFTFDREVEFEIFDNVTKKSYDGTIGCQEKICQLLNEQDKEIGLLRLELDTHKHPLWSTREAERKVNKLADSLADEVKKNGVLNEEINQLRIENMRLKDRIKVLEK